MLVYATDAGISLLQALQPRIDEHHADVATLLGERNARQLERLLTILIEESERPAA